MPHVPIPWDLTFALAKKERKETGETAQVNSSLIKVLSRPRMLTVAEKRDGRMIKCLLTELGRAGRENIWPSVMEHGPRCARSVRHDLWPNIFPSGPPTQSISTYYSLDVLGK